MVVAKNQDCYDIKQLINEVDDLYKQLKDNNISDEEINCIFKPIIQKTTNNWIYPNFKYFAIFLITSLLIYYLINYVECVSWNIAAISRIFMIKALLPIWNWPILKNQRCLIENSHKIKYEDYPTKFNCDLCENVHNIDYYTNIQAEDLEKNYLDLQIPVIITGDLQNWPRNSNLIEEIIDNEILSESIPCELASNIHNKLITVGKLLKKAKPDGFFLHFQNCDFEAMKEFRFFAPRPEFLSINLSPIQYNWLIWNRNYNISNYKKIDLIEKIAIVGEMAGNNFFKLKPRNNCEFRCPIIDVKLGEGEALVFTNLWNLEYKPDESGENIAVILETH